MGRTTGEVAHASGEKEETEEEEGVAMKTSRQDESLESTLKQAMATLATCVTALREGEDELDVRRRAHQTLVRTAALVDSRETRRWLGSRAKEGKLQAAGGARAPMCRGLEAEANEIPTQMAFKPIGVVHSCFSQRNGTPRQPLLVPAARARLELASWVDPLALEGLEGYSHCWVFYLFHANTDGLCMLDAAQGAPQQGSTYRSKVRVPRLDGKKMGVLATRSPHRPVPLGLSLVKVESVAGRVVVLGGADIVDGSPVVDLKPYLPFCESLPHATAPPWVQREVGPDEPVRVCALAFEPGAREALEAAWGLSERRVSEAASEFVSLVEQVLSLDIRSIRNRTRQDHREAARRSQQAQDNECAKTRHGEPRADLEVPGFQGAEEEEEAEEDADSTRVLHVVLEGVEVRYQMRFGRRCVVLGGGVVDPRWMVPYTSHVSATASG